MQNQALDRVLCMHDTVNWDRTKILRSGLIYKFLAMPSNEGTVAYYMYLDDEYMGIILPDQLNCNFLRTTLTNLDEYHAIDQDNEIIVR